MTAPMRRWLALRAPVAALALLAVACTSRSPFSRTPADVAVDEPCRFMGTLHKESRHRIERLRSCRAVSHDEWLCMARILEALDEEFTLHCRERRVGYAEIAGEQRSRNAACFASPPDPALVECALLSEDPACLVLHCSGRAR